MSKGLKIGLIFLGSLILFSLFWQLGGGELLNLTISGDLETLSQRIREAGPWAVLVSLVLNLFISLSGILPSVFLTGANTMVFGVVLGFLISWVGEILGAMIAFYFYRWGLKDALKLPANQWGWMKSINRLPRQGKIYALTLVRMAPFVPSGAVTLFASITNIPLFDFLLATALGKFPSILLEVAFSYNLLTIKQNYLNLFLTVVITAVLYVVIKRQMNRLEKND